MAACTSSNESVRCVYWLARTSAERSRRRVRCAATPRRSSVGIAVRLDGFTVEVDMVRNCCVREEGVFEEETNRSLLTRCTGSAVAQA